MLVFLPCIFTDNSHASLFSKAVLGSDDWVLFHGGQRLYDSAMLQWLSNDSRGIINSDGVLTYGGTARGLRRDEIGGDNWNATWYNRVLRAAYRESPPGALVVGEIGRAHV